MQERRNAEDLPVQISELQKHIAEYYKQTAALVEKLNATAKDVSGARQDLPGQISELQKQIR